MIRTDTKLILDDSSNFTTNSFYKLDWWDTEYNVHKQEFSVSFNTRLREIELYGRYFGSTQDLNLKIYKGEITDTNPVLLSTQTLTVTDQKSVPAGLLSFSFTENQNIILLPQTKYFFQLEVDVTKGTLHLSCDLNYSGSLNSTLPVFTYFNRPAILGTNLITTNANAIDYWFEVHAFKDSSPLVNFSFTWNSTSTDTFPIEPTVSINGMGSVSTLKELGINLKIINTTGTDYIALIQADTSFLTNSYTFKLSTANLPQNVSDGWSRLYLAVDTNASVLSSITWANVSNFTSVIPNYSQIKYHFNLKGDQEVNIALESGQIHSSIQNILNTLSTNVNSISTKKGVGTRTFTYSNYTYSINNKTHIDQAGLLEFVNDFKSHILDITRRTNIQWGHLDVIDSTQDLVEDETWDKLELERLKTDDELPVFENTSFDTQFSVTDNSYQTHVNQNNDERTVQRLTMRERAEGRYRYRQAARAVGRYRYIYRSRYAYWNTWRKSGFGRWEGWYRYVTGSWARAQSQPRAQGSYRYEYRYQTQAAFRYRSPYRYEGRAVTQRYLNTSYRNETAYWTWAVVDKQGDVDTWNVVNTSTNQTVETGTEANFENHTHSETKETASADLAVYSYTWTDTQDGVEIDSGITGTGVATMNDYPAYPAAHSWDARELYFERANVLKINNNVIERSTSSHTIPLPMQATASTSGIVWW